MKVKLMKSIIYKIDLPYKIIKNIITSKLRVNESSCVHTTYIDWFLSESHRWWLRKLKIGKNYEVVNCNRRPQSLTLEETYNILDWSRVEVDDIVIAYPIQRIECWLMTWSPIVTYKLRLQVKAEPKFWVLGGG